MGRRSCRDGVSLLNGGNGTLFLDRWRSVERRDLGRSHLSVGSPSQPRRWCRAGRLIQLSGGFVVYVGCNAVCRAEALVHPRE